MKLYLWNKTSSNKFIEWAHWPIKPYIWEFTWDSSLSSYVYKTRKNIYRIVFGNKDKPIWIGRVFTNSHSSSYCWITCEKELGVIKLEMEEGVFHWK